MDSAPIPQADDNAQAAQALRVAFFAMATLAELRESDTESHLLRVQRYVRVLADKLKSHPAFAATLTPAYVDLCAPACRCTTWALSASRTASCSSRGG